MRQSRSQQFQGFTTSPEVFEVGIVLRVSL
jgi:hypothetical protein